MFVVLASGAGLSYWLQTISMTTACEKLVKRLRVLAFSNILRQPVSWMDEDDNSPFKLCTKLARDAPLVKSVCVKFLLSFSRFLTSISHWKVVICFHTSGTK
jgi:ABC-type multidrug transport system, ATPase and permease components